MLPRQPQGFLATPVCFNYRTISERGAPDESMNSQILNPWVGLGEALHHERAIVWDSIKTICFF